jgi:hypothetical protein
VRLRTKVICAVVGLLVLAGGVVFVIFRLRAQIPGAFRTEGCAVRTASGVVDLSTEQMANAATISAVGLRRGVPGKGIVVALAASLQESKLRNLAAGDLDSIGLFQQRPSQGWGDEAQLQDPRYAAGSFYSALLRVSGWQNMRVTEAAQLVQRSAYPEAYEKWADEAAVLASAFAGLVPNAVACTLVGAPNHRGEAAAVALLAGLRLDWGQLTTFATNSAGLVLGATDTQVGWQYAHWIVAHSAANGVERVRFGGQEWSAESGEWQGVEPTATELNAQVGGSAARVVAEVFQA